MLLIKLILDKKMKQKIEKNKNIKNNDSLIEKIKERQIKNN